MANYIRIYYFIIILKYLGNMESPKDKEKTIEKAERILSYINNLLERKVECEEICKFLNLVKEKENEKFMHYLNMRFISLNNILLLESLYDNKLIDIELCILSINSLDEEDITLEIKYSIYWMYITFMNLIKSEKWFKYPPDDIATYDCIIKFLRSSGKTRFLDILKDFEKWKNIFETDAFTEEISIYAAVNSNIPLLTFLYENDLLMLESILKSLTNINSPQKIKTMEYLSELYPDP